MKKLSIFMVMMLVISLNAYCQHQLTYSVYSLGSTDTSYIQVLQFEDEIQINSLQKNDSNKQPIPGTAQHNTFYSYTDSSIFSQLCYADDENYYSIATPVDFNKFQFEGKETINGYSCSKYSTVSFSNKIEFWATNDLSFSATCIASYSHIPGVMVQYRRNGNATITLTNIKKDKSLKKLIPENLGVELSDIELDRLEKEKLVITTTVFDHAQIAFIPRDTNPSIISYDTVIPFSNGTVILKRINLDTLPLHYQLFAELTEQSNGDAYDRTGSIFVIPMSQKRNFLQGLTQSPKELPQFTDRDGNQYQGIMKTEDYFPIVELMRFFTPFGVHHFNQYRSLKDRDWADSVLYKQEISELRQHLQGEVYIGAFIGNYDGGGHIISLQLKAYPGDEFWDLEGVNQQWSMPLFNTCNVLEMTGQNYGQLFLTDSLTVTFEVPAGVEHLQLRYITTGHGGWGGGDEFVPKENTIIVDSEVAFKYTPWREDCGTYRIYNPASGNFWNGVSSSDYSRSGWCPGTATQPVYINLSHLKPGKHTLTVAIPQGERAGNSFSAWNISGVLLGKINH